MDGCIGVFEVVKFHTKRHRAAGKPPLLTTYLLRRDAEPSQPLARFIERVEALGPELPGR